MCPGGRPIRGLPAPHPRRDVVRGEATPSRFWPTGSRALPADPGAGRRVGALGWGNAEEEPRELPGEIDVGVEASEVGYAVHPPSTAAVRGPDEATSSDQAGPRHPASSA